MDNFFVFLLIALFVASLQDLKRREVDNWLNLLLIFSGFSFLIFKSIFELNSTVLILGVISFFVMFVFANLFYYGRVFAGGDAKLLIAMFAVFVAGDLISTINNIGIFIFLLLFSGSLYGLIWGFGLFFSNFNKTKKVFYKNINSLKYFLIVCLIFCLLFFVNFYFLIFGIFIFLLQDQLRVFQ